MTSLGIDSTGYRETDNEDIMKHKLITDNDNYKKGKMRTFYSLQLRLGRKAAATLDGTQRWEKSSLS